MEGKLLAVKGVWNVVYAAFLPSNARLFAVRSEIELAIVQPPFPVLWRPTPVMKEFIPDGI